jgi:hypothetical protein
MKSTFLSSRLAMLSWSSLRTPTTSTDQDYLVGLRGLLVVQSFVFVFFQTFLPAAVPESKNIDGPTYQVVLRKSFSVLFCNEALIYSWIIFLSARTICLPYLVNKAREVCASSVFRRGIRLWIPTFVAYSIAAAAFSTSSTDYITDFLTATGNISTSTPMRFRNFLIYFNSLFDIFWLNKGYSSQAANQAFPSGTFWIVSVLFQQSYTVYITMVIIPYTRTSWRVKAMLAFILAAFWVQSWAWYSISGLLIADAVLNMVATWLPDRQPQNPTMAAICSDGLHRCCIAVLLHILEDRYAQRRVIWPYRTVLGWNAERERGCGPADGEGRQLSHHTRSATPD